MQDALADGTPMVVIYSPPCSMMRGCDEFQVPDINSIASACTKWTARVENAAELKQRLDAAFEIAISGRPGPVLLEISSQLLAMRQPFWPAQDRIPGYLKPLRAAQPRDIQETALERVAKLVDGAQRPVLYVGQGILASPQGPAILKEFADKTNIPVTTTLQGLGAFDELDHKSLHMMGLHGTNYANLAIQSADLILAVGARFDDRVTGAISKFVPVARAAAASGKGGIVHFEIAPKNINKVIQATEAIVGDCASSIKQLTPLVRHVKQRPEWFAQIEEWKRSFPLSAYKHVKPLTTSIRPQEVVESLSNLTAHMKDKVLISTGVGQHQMWTAQHYRWRHPRTMITSGGLGTMGYGLPAAIGAKLARPDCLVLDIDGDASFSMTLNELATIAYYNIPVKVIIFNNEEMGMVSDLQRFYYSERFAHNKLVNPDFVALSEAFGVSADRVVTLSEVDKKLQWLINHDGPAVLEVVTERNVPVWPMVPAGKALHEGITYPKLMD